MDENEREKLLEALSNPGPNEESFFAKRRMLGIGTGLDEDGNVVHLQGPVFIDFEASSLSPQSWPIEVGIAWLDGNRVVVESKLIKPDPSWPEGDWNPESEAVHNIPRSDLEDAEPAKDVAQWLRSITIGRTLVSDAPEFDQRWLDRLLSTIEEPLHMQIDDFNRILRIAFSHEDGIVAPGRLHYAYKNRMSRKAIHRAGSDAANLAYAYRAGLPKKQRTEPGCFQPVPEEKWKLQEGGDGEED
ncbi:exonuclease domain-containing protein [uncultured Aliiroseovarius sp.]|uniref:3'-5' exonuclease n=1 Tax=uncultured Aliiroseovarius sp. TaxID=1658783 RepID=UPI00261AA355|nr:exonuclease domain-containing protein [uncultured Aliiroseovarius sp.]